MWEGKHRPLLEPRRVLNMDLGNCYVSVHTCKFLYEKRLKICALMHVVS